MACASEAAQSPELSALVKNIALLSDGITNVSTVTHFALLLEEGGFITSDKSRSVRQTLGISEHDKCVSLLDAVKEQVKISPAKFNAFIDLLNREPALQIYTDKLTKSHGEWYTFKLFFCNSILSYRRGTEIYFRLTWIDHSWNRGRGHVMSLYNDHSFAFLLCAVVLPCLSIHPWMCISNS